MGKPILIRGLLLLCVLSGAHLMSTTTHAATTFSECPAVGNDSTGCEFLITITGASGGVATAFNTTVSSPDLGPYDGSDDTLIGVLNASGTTVTSLSLASTIGADIFGFDGDGACSGTWGVLPGCTGSKDPYGYAPVGITFSGINAAQTSGTVNFTLGLGNGASNWFSLENAISANQITPVPLPAAAWLLFSGLVGMVAFARMKTVRPTTAIEC
jgi:hypothetical protein